MVGHSVQLPEMEAMRVYSKDIRLALYVALGALAGGVFVAFDLFSEAKIGAGTLQGGLSDVHALVDHTLPVVVGALLGVWAHYLRLRARLSVAEDAAARADALRVRLQKVERDQAVWVLAAAILHELNNPLHAIGLLLDELDSSRHDPDEHAELLGRARRQAERSLTALRQLRELRTSAEPCMQPIALSHIVSSLAVDAGALAAEDGIEVKIECGDEVCASADPTFIRTILENLVHNSMQSLRARGGHITIVLAQEPGHAIVRVYDDGPGIDPASAAAIFTPLISTKPTGLGLGLPIARALARAMRGDLLLEDLSRTGFRLELPLGRPT